MFTGQVAASFSHHSLVVVIECVSVSRFCSNGETAGNLQRGKSNLSYTFYSSRGLSLFNKFQIMNRLLPAMCRKQNIYDLGLVAAVIVNNFVVCTYILTTYMHDRRYGRPPGCSIVSSTTATAAAANEVAGQRSMLATEHIVRPERTDEAGSLSSSHIDYCI